MSAYNNLEEMTERLVPRRPMRGPGIIRYKALLDATETLLNKNEPEDVGIYQIAETAKSPTASAYHFFPTKDAAFLALMERYVVNFIEISAVPVDITQINTWQDVIKLELSRAAEFYNTHPAAMKIFYSGYSSGVILQSDRDFQLSIANTLYARLNTIFHMPEIDEPEHSFLISVAIMDSIWGLSYQKHKNISDRFFEESCRACLNYLGLCIPSGLKLRDKIIVARHKNQKVSLPPYRVPE